MFSLSVLTIMHSPLKSPSLINCALRRYALMFGMSLLPLSSARAWLLRICGVKVGKGCYIGFNVIADTNYPSLIIIGDHVTISHNCSLIAHTQTPVKQSFLSTIYNSVKPITIEEGAWIGMNVTLLPGAYIKQNCFIAAGSVVPSMTTSSFSVYAGNPLKLIKYLPHKEAR
jgi:acetyltransferase-like isoleucine patch superfamily enzyme